MARSTPFAALRAQMRPETRARAVALTDALRQEMNLAEIRRAMERLIRGGSPAIDAVPRDTHSASTAFRAAPRPAFAIASSRDAESLTVRPILMWLSTPRLAPFTRLRIVMRPPCSRICRSSPGMTSRRSDGFLGSLAIMSTSFRP